MTDTGPVAPPGPSALSGSGPAPLPPPDQPATPPTPPPAAPRHRWPIRHRLALMLALAMAPAGILALADGWRGYAAHVQDKQRAFMTESQLAVGEERDALIQTRGAMGVLALSPGVVALDPPACNAALAGFIAGQGAYAVAAVSNLRGQVVCASTPLALGLDNGQSAEFQAFLAEPKFTIGAVRTGRVSGERVLVALAPVRNQGRLVGMLSVSLRTAFLDRVAAATDTSLVRQVALVDERGTVIAHDQPKGYDALTWLSQRTEMVELLTATPALLTTRGPDGRAIVLAIAPLFQGEVWMVTLAPRASLGIEPTWVTLPTLSLPVLMWIVAIAVAYFSIDRLVVRHVVYLSRITRAYGKGRLKLDPIGIAGAPREIADLGEALTTMARRLDKRTNALRQSAETNQVLLAEVYHRVKNNLQMITSLLNLQSRQARSADERLAIARIQSRIHSLALVHQRLYAVENMRQIALDALVREIVGHLRAMDPDDAARPAEVSFDLAPVIDGADRATPVVMFLNEAVTNALKYAESPGGGPRRIEIALACTSADGYALTVRNTVGPGAVIDPRGGSLGQGLMAGFARQVRGALALTVVDGWASLTLTVPPRSDSAQSPDALRATG